MNCKQKRLRLKQIINRLQEIESSKEIDYILSDTDIWVLEALLGIRKSKSQQTEKQVKRISGRGLKNGRKKSK